MRKFYLISTLVLALLFAGKLYAQDFSNKGKDFWVGYGYHERMLQTNPPGGTQDMVLYFAAEQASNVTVTIPSLGYSASYSVPANSVITSSPLPKTGAQDARLNTEGLSNKGIHIVSDKAIVTYAHVYNQSVSGATILFPTNTLGKEYYSVNYKNVSNQNNANCFFYVVATDTGTTSVNITPSANTIGGWLAGNTYNITMTQGQVYNVMGVLTTTTNPFTAVDLSGSKIESVATANGGCKKIAVFSGSGRISITCNNNSSSSDNYMVQAFPKTAWGKKYLTVPASGNQNFNIYRVCVADPTTVVSINGVVTALPLQSNFYYEIAATNQPQLIEADKPVMVAQYFTSQGACGNGAQPGDPEVLYLSPVEQNINKVLWNATPNFQILQHYFNVVIQNSGTAVSSFRLDGAVPSGIFTVHPQDPAYVYLRQSVSAGPHVIQSDSGFNSIAYGFGNAESYGYNGGTNIKDLFQFIQLINPYGTVPFPATCRGTPFNFAMVFPYRPIQINWIFGPLLNAMGINDTTIYNAGNPIVEDSSWVVAGRTVYRYKLPSTYYIIAIGTYPIKVVATNPTPDGCGNEQIIDFDVQVFEPPVADFNFVTDGCVTTAVSFSDNSNTGGRPIISRHWNFGDATTSSLAAPSHLYAAAGTYNVKYSLITDVGCLADTVIHPVTLNDPPVANFTFAAPLCINVPVQFTDASTVTGGATINQWAWDFGDGGTSTIQNPTHTYASAGTFNVTLIVQTTTGCPSVVFTLPVTIAPDGTITLTSAPGTNNQTVCMNAPITNITYAVGGSSNGGSVSGLPTGVTGIYAAGVITISGTPTAAPGVYNYTVTTTGPCVNPQATGTITVNPLPTATISGSTAVCLNAAQPNITFTGAGSTAPYTFTYNINGGPNLFVTTVAGNSVTVAVPTNVAGTFVYNLISVQDGSPTACIQAQSGTATVIVHPLPTASFSYSAPSCETGTVCFTDLSVANAGSITGWSWDFGDGNNSSLQNPCHTYAVAGTYNVTLVVTTDNGCVSINPAQQVIIYARPLAGYIVPAVCLSDTYAQFTDTSKVAVPDNIVAWNWDFGDPGSGPLNFSTLQNPQHSYSATGSYNVQLIVTSNRGCKDTIIHVLFVNGSFPVADFIVQSPSALCANDSVAIAEASTVFPGTITKVEIYWDNAGQPAVFDTDNFPVSGKIYKHLYPNFQVPLTRTFTIRYRAYSGGVCVNDKFSDITVNAAPLVQFNPMPNICYDAAPYQIPPAIASEIGGVPGSGIFTGPGVSLTGLFSPALAGVGTHQILYTFTSSAGGCVDTASNFITVWDTASAKIIVQPLACERSDVSFDASGSTIPAGNGSITGWSWNFGDPASGPQNISSLQSPLHQFTGWGLYNVTLFVTTSNGCKSPVSSQIVNVNPIARPRFTFTDTACLPSANVAFKNLSTIPDGTESSFSYNWNFGDPGSGINNTATIKDPSHIYNSVGNYPVTLQVTAGNGCVHDTVIIVNSIHPQPTALFNTDKVDVCIGGGIQFTDNSDPADGTPIRQWVWDLGNGTSNSTPSFNYIYPNTGIYDVTLYIYNSYKCKSTTYTIPVSVNPYPLADAGPDKYMLEGGQVQLTPSLVTNIPVSYLWTPSNFHLSDPTIAYTIASPPYDFTYTLTVTSDKGCARSDDVFIKVLKLPAIPNIFSPNGDGIHDTWVIQYLDTYPGNTVDIFNRYGQKIFHSEGYGKPWDGKVNGKDVPVGTYYYIIAPKNGRKIMTGYVDVIR